MSQLPRTKTIRLSTPKTTTGENLILGYTSPLNLWDHSTLLHWSTVHPGWTLAKTSRFFNFLADIRFCCGPVASQAGFQQSGTFHTARDMFATVLHQSALSSRPTCIPPYTSHSYSFFQVASRYDLAFESPI